MKKLMNSCFIGAMALFLMSGMAVAQVVVDMDFETDQSSNFTVQNADTTSGLNDYAVDFNFDYSTFTQTSGTTPYPITLAPNSASGATKGIKVEVNNSDTTGEPAAVTLFPTAAAGLTEWDMTFDVWMNYNGDSGGASGSTEFFSWGGASDTSACVWNAGSCNAFELWMSGENGAAVDYQYYEGTGSTPVASHSTPNWHGANATSGGVTEWTNFFPQDNAPQQTAGAPGKRWVTVVTTVDNTTPPATVTVSMADGDGDPALTEVSSFTVTSSSVTPVQAFIGYIDIWGSIANPSADNFAVIDNLVIRNLQSVSDWNEY